MRNVHRTATALVPVLLVFAFLYTVFTAGGTLDFALMNPEKWSSSRWVDPDAPSPLWQRLLYISVWWLPVAFGLFAVYAALRTVLMIRNGILFDERVCWRLRQVGIGTTASGFTDLVANLVSPTLLSWNNPSGPEAINWYFDSEPAGLIVCGGGFYLIGWILAEARRLADENDGFV
ncbi:MAG: DUF2975 domain-containing protein [Epibacterium sp.]|nr:DUF2975 domain-containing protein [Epibacterium sp.]